MNLYTMTHQGRFVRERGDAGQAAHALAARQVWQRLVALLRRAARLDCRVDQWRSQNLMQSQQAT